LKVAKNEEVDLLTAAAAKLELAELDLPNNKKIDDKLLTEIFNMAKARMAKHVLAVDVDGKKYIHRRVDRYYPNILVDTEDGPLQLKSFADVIAWDV